MRVKEDHIQNVLVVGGAGFVGRHTVHKLVAEGHQVFATHHPDRHVDFHRPRLVWLPTDVTASDATAKWPNQCDSVIYLAQSRSWHDFPAVERDVFEVNVSGLVQAAWYAHRVGAQRFIYASSGSVYTQVEKPAVEEEYIEIAKTRNLYTASKLAAELLLSAYRSLFTVITLRLYFPYGAFQNPRMLFPRLVESVREGRAVTLHGDHGFECNPIAISDVTEAIRRCLCLEESTTMNIAGPEKLTLRQIVAILGEALGRVPVFEPDAQGSATVIAGDITKCQKTLGWRPTATFSQGVREWLEQEGLKAA